jgi:hypothetical protein
MKTLLTQTSIENIGFSLPTLERLRSENVLTFGDLIIREEKVTASLFTKEAIAQKQNMSTPIDELGISGNLRNILLRKKYKTVGDILSKSFDDVLDWNYGGSKMHLVVKLVDLGFTVTDGPLLNQFYFAEKIRHMQMFRTLLGMDKRGLLSKKFKVWFNTAIEGKVYNSDNRPTRKYKIVPFKIED